VRLPLAAPHAAVTAAYRNFRIVKDRQSLEREFAQILVARISMDCHIFEKINRIYIDIDQT
jgi:hypothetical protein